MFDANQLLDWLQDCREEATEREAHSSHLAIRYNGLADAYKAVHDHVQAMLSSDSQSDRDWTRGPGGASNSSVTFYKLVHAVDLLIKSSAHDLICGTPYNVATLIVAQLAHVHGMVPTKYIDTTQAVLEGEDPDDS